MKKKLLTALLSAFACVSLAACNPSGTTTSKETTSKGGETTSVPTETTSTQTPGTTTSTTNPDVEPVGVIFHYRRADDNYSTFNAIWVWPKGGSGTEFSFDKTDDYGRYTVIDLDLTDIESVGFIVKKKGEWTKDGDADRFADLELFNLDNQGYYHIYLVGGDTNIYTSEKGAVSDGIANFDVTFDKTSNKYRLSFVLTTECDTWVIKKNGSVFADSATIATDDRLLSPVDQILKKVTIEIGETMPNFDDVIELTADFPDEKTLVQNAAMASLYDTEQFKELYTYDGELGAIYSETSTTFRVWTPLSTEMTLRIYENGTPVSVNGTLGSDQHTDYAMVRGDKGTWEATVSGDLDGKYYTYVVTNYMYKEKEIVDPYAKSTGVNGKRGMIVNFDKINEELDWDNFSINEYGPTSLAVYETHIADLTSSSTWSSDPNALQYAKTYKGFYLEGTTYTEGDVTVTTGFDHIKELGVNAVQIIPIFDSDNDEVNPTFNWGYNPLNYNALDGSYSTNPYDGYEKIREFKSLVKAYTESGINIIMDVVYNHVMSANESNFDVLMPYYYYRYNGSSLSNGSGCGNETASNMPMFRKFMIDSTEFWASEYKLGGFRFDLMGVHDLETMNELSENLHDKVSEYVTVYGEPWSGGGVAYDSTKLATQANILKFTEYGCFNDKLRDALIKGGLNSPESKGWITGGVSYQKKTYKSSSSLGRALNAGQVIYKFDGTNYIQVTSADEYDANETYYQLVVSGPSKVDMTNIVNGISGYELNASMVALNVTEDTFVEVQAVGLYTFNGTEFVLVPNSATFDENETYYVERNTNYPYQCVNYVTCHDNFTLWDRIKAAGITDEDTIKKMAVLANSVVFTSQGITFMLAGEEFLRTKGGDSNSYQSSYKVNELDYSLKIKNQDVFEIYQKLIEFKTGFEKLHLTSKEEAQIFQQSITVSEDNALITYRGTFEKGTDTYEYMVVHCSAVGGGIHTIDIEGWTIWLDTLNTGKEATNNYEVENYQTLILRRSVTE